MMKGGGIIYRSRRAESRRASAASPAGKRGTDPNQQGAVAARDDDRIQLGRAASSRPIVLAPGEPPTALDAGG
jgi:hypothetical protein